jgi:hypothetical protein
MVAAQTVSTSTGSLTIPSNTGLPTNSNGIAGVLSNVLMWLLAIIGTLSVIAFVVSGIQYLTAAGDEKNIETAKKNLTYSVIGVVVALSGLIIVTTISMILGGTAPTAVQ